MVIGDCTDGPHRHIQVSSGIGNCDVSPSVYEYSEFLRKQRTVSHPPTKLSFSENGKFKIAVFTDLHYGEGEVICDFIF